ncbi:MAG: DUF3466 family protein [Phycisphaerales bacterium]|nr:DUF3466 family protein [Phycisphaerales bacterium]
MASDASAQCHYQTVVLGAEELCGGAQPASMFPWSLNEFGQVVGDFACGIGFSRPFVWRGDGPLVEVPVPLDFQSGTAFDISEGGTIVGGLMIGGGRFKGPVGFLFADRVMTVLEPLPGGDTVCAHAVNDAQQVVGFWGDTGSGSPLSGSMAFLWDDGVMLDLAPDLGTMSSDAYDINDAGQVVGWMGVSILLDGRAFIWDDGVVIDLGPVPDGVSSFAFAINDVGQVVGQGQVPEDGTTFGRGRGFLWDNGAMSSVGVLPGFENSRATDVNNRCLVVGTCWGGSPTSGYVWHDGVMHDLNDLTSSPERITDVSGVNDSGSILARLGGNGVALLVPIDPPAADVTGDCAVDHRDLQFVIDAWGRSESVGDLDGDGEVGFGDLLRVLSGWTAP